MIDTFRRLGIAPSLGLLAGLQRERTDARLAGCRTFPLVTLFGALCGLLAANLGGWIVAGGMGALALVIVGGNLPLLRAGAERPGVTTGATAPELLRPAAGPLGAMFAVLALAAWGNLRGHGGAPSNFAAQENPTELKPALLFGALYAVVLLAIATANHHFGREGLYATAVVSGLMDMDAIALSVSHLVNSAGVATSTGWRVILVAAMANLGFKAATVALLGGRPLLGRVAVGFGAAVATGAAMLVFWPD